MRLASSCDNGKLVLHGWHIGLELCPPLPTPYCTFVQLLAPVDIENFGLGIRWFHVAFRTLNYDSCIFV